MPPLHPGQLDELFRQRGGWLVGALEEGVVEAELRVLPRGGIGEALIVKAERGAPKAGHRVDVFLAAAVEHADAFAALHDERPLLLQEFWVGLGMDVIRRIPMCDRIGEGCLRHGFLTLEFPPA